MVSSLNGSDWLEWIEKLMAPSAGTARPAELPRGLFHCRLDDQPDHLVPERYLRPELVEDPSDRPLVLNPGCIFVRPGEALDETYLPDIANSRFACWQNAGAYTIAWVRDSATGGLAPFWIEPELSELLTTLEPGEPAPQEFLCDVVRILHCASVLVGKNHTENRREEWQRIVGVCAPHFHEKGYVPIGRLIHPYHIAALRRYYRHQLRTGAYPLGDSQTELRFAASNEPVARFFHQQLTGAVSDIVGQRVNPSYVYLSSYQEGAILKEHIDREQCEFSITLCLDYSPEPTLATPWPLRLHTKNGSVAVFQALGDALLYRGREIPHSRRPLPTGHSSTSLFFHYVKEDFAGSLD